MPGVAGPAPPAVTHPAAGPAGIITARSVGEPGLNSRRPLAVTVSHGMCECPKTSTSESGKRAEQRSSRPRAGLMHHGHAQPVELDAGDLGQPGT